MTTPDRTAAERTVARRPPDRKQRIAAAASALFSERGFDKVYMADVAGAVGISAPALYKHFRNKQALLTYVVHSGLASFDTASAQAETLDAALRGSAALAAEHKGIASLWTREARHLPEDEREQARLHITRVAQRIAALIQAERPGLAAPDAELPAWACLALLAGQSTHRTSLSRRRYETLLTTLMTAVARAELGPASEADGPAGAAATAPPSSEAAAEFAGSRRERILAEATRLFAARGFLSVTTEDIGEAVGTSGPNVYKYFASKDELLWATIVRGGDRREAATAAALAAGSGGDALERLLRAYIGFATENADLLALLATEPGYLPDHQRKRGEQVQRDFTALWVHLLGERRPDLPGPEARVVVHAALGVVDNLVRTGRVAGRTDLPTRLAKLGDVILAADTHTIG